MSCFMHPGWECKEAGSQRAAMAAEAGKGITEARVSEEKSHPQAEEKSHPQVDVNSGVPSMDEVQKPIDLGVGQEQQPYAQGQPTEQQLLANGGDEGILKDSSDVSA